MPTQIATAAATTGEAYSVNRRSEVLCDGSQLVLYQSAVGTLSLVRVTTPGGTPGTTSVTQTFSVAGGSNTVGSVFVLNNGTTTSDVWVVWSDNSTTLGLWVAHGTFTASGATWNWDNTSTSIALGTLANGFMVPSIVWTGTYLIIATRGGVSNYTTCLTYTTTKNGSTGWATVYELETEGASSHAYSLILHDPVETCSILVYTISGDTVYARVLADSAVPSAANWSAKVALSGTVNVGAAGVSAILDTGNQRLHVAFDNTGGTTNPLYNSATYTTTSISAGTAFGAGNGGTASTGPAIGLDAGSPPTAYIFWASAGPGAASDIMYIKLNSPYGSGNLGTVTNLTNSTGTDNAYPHVPLQTLMSGYVPLVYAHTVTPWAIEYDNSIAASSGSIAIVATMSGVGSLSATILVGNVPLTATLAGAGSLVATPEANISPGTTLGGTGSLSAVLTVNIPMRTITVSTRSQSWSGGPAGSPGTETDIVITDPNGNGNYWGMIPSYGAVAISAWGPVAANVLGANQTSMTTSVPDGKWHWLEQNAVGAFAGSEDGQNWTLTELGPTGSSFRRYYRGTWGPDANGFTWTAYVCVYPSDPVRISVRYDMANLGGSSIALAGSDGVEVAVVAGMQQNDATWVATNGKYGTVGSAETAWPTASANGSPVVADPDYFYIVPANGGATTYTQYTVKQKRSASLSPAWASPQVSALVNTSRLKLKQQGDMTSFPANTTSTLYLLGGVTSSAAAKDIAADYLNPGTPTMAIGSYTGFSYDELAYVCAASGSAVTITLDFTPAHVTTRFSPVFKITGWTANAPVLKWGAASLQVGYDYNYLVDTVGQVLYVQLGRDVVASGATGTQLTNAALSITPGLVLSATLAGAGSVSAAAEPNINPVAMLAGAGSISASVTIGISPATTLAGVGGVFGALTVGINPTALERGVGALSATVSVGINPTPTLAGVGSVSAVVVVGTLAITAILNGVGSMSAVMSISVTIQAEVDGVGSMLTAVSVALALVAAVSGQGSMLAVVSVGRVLGIVRPVATVTLSSGPVGSTTIQ